MRVVLVDDHAVLREALRHLLIHADPTIDVVAEAATARDAIAVVKAHRPDVVLMDLMLPGSSGVSATREIVRAAPKSRVLVFTGLTEPGFAVDALSVGAHGYILKTQPIEDLVFAIAQVHRGERYLAPDIERKLGDKRTRKGTGDGLLAELSVREREVFDLVVAGYTNQRLAAELFISVKTVETHRSRINRKLRVHSTAELVRFAALHRLISPS